MSDYVLNARTMDAVKDALDRSLKAPASAEENPTFKAGAAEGLGTWMEAFIIRDTSWADPKTPRPGVDASVAQIQLEVLGPAEGGYATNAGAQHYHTAYIDFTSMADTASKMRGINFRRIGVLQQLVQACGYDPATQEISLEAVLNADANGLKALVGMRVGGVVRKYVYTKDRGKATEEQVKACEIDGFCPLPS